MNDMTPIEVFHRAHELVRDYDIRWVDSFAPDGVLELPFAPEPMPKRIVGREAIRDVLAPRMAAAKAARRQRIVYRDLVIHETTDPTVIIAEFTAEGVPSVPPLPFIHVLRIVKGEIALQRDYFDSQLMAERLRRS